MFGKKMKLITGLLALLMVVPAVALAAETVVSPAWLQANLSKVTVVDIRKVEDYNAGHIPGAINVFYGVWAIQKAGLLNELPADDDLRDILSAAGIEPSTNVVVAGSVDNIGERANITRVAWTLKYAGVANVAILNGGLNAWVSASMPVSREAVKPKAKPYRGAFNKAILVNKAQAVAALGKAIVVDTREPDFFSGAKKLDFVARPGHLKGAVNLPSAQAFNADGTYKPMADIEAMAKKVVGDDKAKEIIVYCDSGRVASIWWYLLSQSMGYTNVKLYDGSAQDFAKDSSVPLEP
ncbi:MAG TPA: rhodanese-like domain-containing protein [Syntrophales bacterium]|nr:rhodanese-like domain-containing protein [Syntrophales bacterium]